MALAVPSVARAAPIALWGFADGTADDALSTYDLSAVGGGPDLSLGFARFDGSEASPSFLEVSGPGGMSTYTISLWVRSQGSLDQGPWQGILSNNTASTAPWSWQIESYGGVYQWRNQAGLFVIGTPTGLGQWDHIVIRKWGGVDGDVWFNGVQIVSSLGGNPGGLQNFRFGTNRNTNNLWQGDVAGAGVWDTLEDPAALFASPPASVPEPALALLCLPALAWAVRRGE